MRTRTRGVIQYPLGTTPGERRHLTTKNIFLRCDNKLGFGVVKGGEWPVSLVRPTGDRVVRAYCPNWPTLLNGAGMLSDANGRHLNPFMLKGFLSKLSSGSLILLTITRELIIILQKICMRVVGSVLNDISPSN